MVDKNGWKLSDSALCNILAYPSNLFPGLLTQERCFQLIEHASNGIWMIDTANQTTYVNEALAQMLGYSTQEMLGKSLLNFLGVEEAKEALGSYVTRRQSGILEQYEVKFIHHDGRDIWAMISAMPLLDAQGRYEGAIAQVIDNTAQKQVEQELRKAVERETLIRRLSEMISQTFNLEQILIHSAREIGEYFQADRCVVLRYDKEDKDGKLSSQFRRSADIAPIEIREVPPQVRLALMQANPPDYLKGTFIARSQSEYFDFIAACLHQMGFRGEDFDRSLELMKRWISKYNIQSALRLIIYYRNQPFGLIFVHQCKYNRVWTDEEVKLLQHIGTNLGVAFYQTELYLHEQKAKEEAELANERKNQFLSTITHELRTPLHGVLGFSQMLEQGIAGPLNEKQQKYVQHVVNSGQHLLNLVDDLLDLTKVAAGTLEIHPESMELCPFLEALKTAVSLMAEKRNINILFEVEPEITTIYADPVRLRQILLNLLVNAIKFNKENGEVRLRVQQLIQEKPQPPMLVIQVEDTGVGISAENIKRLFKTFSQIDSSLARRQEGAGLGLALTKYLVELHGGSISVESEEGQGSIFTVKLPMVALLTHPSTL